MLSKVLFSSQSDEWETPDKIINELKREFYITLDVCATDENSKCVSYFTKKDDGLSICWKSTFYLIYSSGYGIGFAFMNPPYSQIKDWVKKASEEAKKGVSTVCLLPARTDTKWFHEYLYNKPNVEIRFIKGRLKFSNSKNSAPFPSMIAVIRGNKTCPEA